MNQRDRIRRSWALFGCLFKQYLFDFDRRMSMYVCVYEKETERVELLLKMNWPYSVLWNTHLGLIFWDYFHIWSKRKAKTSTEKVLGIIFNRFRFQLFIKTEDFSPIDKDLNTFIVYSHNVTIDNTSVEIRYCAFEVWSHIPI